MERLRLGVSRCLLGEPVRYDGGHRRDRYLTEVLAAHFELVSVCPEVGAGLGTPRPPVRLVRTPAGRRILGVEDPTVDVTEALDGYYDRVRARFAEVSGFVLKRGSPSCGVLQVKVFDEAGRRVGADAGAFAKALRAARPHLPMEEEGRLGEAGLRESFLTRVFTYHRWRRMGPGEAELRAFHAAHEMLVRVHDPAAWDRLTRLIDRLNEPPASGVRDSYAAELMGALGRAAPAERHAHLMMQAADQLGLDSTARAALGELIEQYQRGEVPRAAPLATLGDHLRRLPHPALSGQVYLAPGPDEWLVHGRG